MISLTNSSRTLSDESKRKLQNFWRDYTYLVINEMSMISKSFLALLSQMISTAKATDEFAGQAASFGGINAILCGDFHQFPPVVTPPYEALYFPANTQKNSVDALLGRTIYEEFETVMVLKEQIRCTDPEWHDFLQHLHYGRVQEHHVHMLRTLVLGDSHMPPTDFKSEPWQDASLVTPHHKVRIRWNELALRKHCQRTHHQVFICHAEDTIKGRALSRREKNALQNRSSVTKKKARQELPGMIELALGMKVMVTTNVEMDLDITNGVRGTIQDIILHPDEEYSKEKEEVVLKHVPLYLLVKLDHTRATPLKGLEEGVIPVEPATKSMQIRVVEEDGSQPCRTVNC